MSLRRCWSQGILVSRQSLSREASIHTMRPPREASLPLTLPKISCVYSVLRAGHGKMSETQSPPLIYSQPSGNEREKTRNTKMEKAFQPSVTRAGMERKAKHMEGMGTELLGENSSHLLKTCQLTWKHPLFLDFY